MNLYSEQVNYPLTICNKSSWYMERSLRYNEICDEKLPLVKIRKNEPNIKITFYQLPIIRDIQNSPLDICFEDDK